MARKHIVSKIALSFSAVCLSVSPIMVQTAKADLAGEMNSYFNDMGGAANVTGPSSYQNQSGGHYALGNVWTRFPQKNISPVNVQLPSARGGCGGIDLFAGSFSFVNVDEFVAQLKATANNALGFAFHLALRSISPMIQDTMSQISDIVNEVNQFNIESCETAQGLVGGLWPKMDATKNDICMKVANSNGIFSDWAAGRQGCNNGNKRESTLDQADGTVHADWIPGKDYNFTWQALNKSPFTKDLDDEFKELLLTMIGTIVTYKAQNDGDEMKVAVFGPIESEALGALLDGDKGRPPKLYKCDNADCLNPTFVNRSLPESSSMRGMVKATLMSIASKIRSDTPLTSQEIGIVNLTTVPIFKILTVQAATNFSVSNSEVDALAEIISIQILMSLMDEVIGDVAAVSGVHTASLATHNAEWIDMVNTAREKIDSRELKINNRVKVAHEIIDRSMTVEGLIQNSMSPRFGAVMKFSQGVNQFGLSN